LIRLKRTVQGFGEDHQRQPMYPIIPTEMIGGVVQLAVLLVTAIGAFLTLMLTARA
jgi:hypothetical protein